ncbi:MAG: hypothetical protein AAF577_17315 [Pseudomonadota bacterium]
MLIQDYAFLKEALPEISGFDHYEGRDAPQLLSASLGPGPMAPMPIANLRSAPFGRLLHRRPLADLVAAAGGGALHPGDIALLADPAHRGATGPMAEQAARIVARAPWQRYRVSLTVWNRRGVGGMQTTQRAPNLVLQLGFPKEHDAAFRELIGHRYRYECGWHPVRSTGPITLAWARLDMNAFSVPGPPEVLIEEVQSDWCRYIARDLDMAKARRSLCKCCARREAALQAYRTVLAPFVNSWPATMLSAVIDFARRELGAERLWMHRPETGAALKRITDVLPPRSLYTDLPRRFCFTQLQEAPWFLSAAARKRLSQTCSRGVPLFWRLDLPRGPPPAAPAR